MHKARVFDRCVVLVFLFCSLNVLAENRERSEVPGGQKWKLEDIYHSDLAWEEAKEELVPQFEQIVRYRGKLGGVSSGNFLQEVHKDLGPKFAGGSDVGAAHRVIYCDYRFHRSRL